MLEQRDNGRAFKPLDRKDRQSRYFLSMPLEAVQRSACAVTCNTLVRWGAFVAGSTFDAAEVNVSALFFKRAKISSALEKLEPAPAF